MYTIDSFFVEKASPVHRTPSCEWENIGFDGRSALLDAQTEIRGVCVS